MELQVGDRIMDETGEWEVTGRPFTTAAGKNAHARVRKVSQPHLTDLRTWGAREGQGTRGGDEMKNEEHDPTSASGTPGSASTASCA
jgi:hypothetical protein